MVPIRRIRGWLPSPGKTCYKKKKKSLVRRGLIKIPGATLHLCCVFLSTGVKPVWGVLETALLRTRG